MAYNKAEAQKVGEEIADTILGALDGIDVGDGANIMELMSALMAGADEIQTDRDAAVLDILSGATSKFASSRQDAPPTT